MSDIIEQDTEFFGIYYLCKNCGAQAKEKSQIKHHATCTPGEADKWEKFYKDAESICFDCGTDVEPLEKRDDGVALCTTCLEREKRTWTNFEKRLRRKPKKSIAGYKMLSEIWHSITRFWMKNGK